MTTHLLRREDDDFLPITRCSEARTAWGHIVQREDEAA